MGTYSYKLTGGKITFQKDNLPPKHGISYNEFKRLSVDANRVYVYFANESHIINPTVDTVILDDVEIAPASNTPDELFNLLNESSVFLKVSTANGGGSTNASDLTSGTLPNARLSSDVVLKNETGHIPMEALPPGVGDVDISGKVDKVDGKSLSSNDYTTTEKNKLAGLSNSFTDLTNVPDFIREERRAAANGVASLGSDGKVPLIAFLATRTTTRNIGAGVSALGCNNIAYSIGGGYSNTSDVSTFTAPVSGIYRFDASVYLGASSVTGAWVGINVTSALATTQNGEYKFNNIDGGSRIYTLTGGIDIMLQAGDTVQGRVYANAIVNIMSTVATRFSGRLVAVTP